MADNLLDDDARQEAAEDEARPHESPAPGRADLPGPPSPTDDGATAAAGVVPEKFRDPETGEVRVAALARSYRELERRLSAATRPPGPDSDDSELAAWREAAGVPRTPDEYDVHLESGLLDVDPEVNRRLHEANFTQRQAQVVYELAEEKLLPVIEAMAAEFEAQRQRERLESHFGGAARWEEVRDAVRRWGEAHLPRAAFEALATTFEGVVALHRMMESGEPALIRGGGSEDALSEEKLREMMSDPRYWRDRDPAWVRRVSDGFRALYPGRR